jgi:hypothetical protein
MTPPVNVAASIRQKLTNRARATGEDFQLLLIRYANERLLYRLSQSEFSSDFVLKGATLFAIWSAEPHRATRDIDLLGFGALNAERLQSVFSTIARDEAFAPTLTAQDGLNLDPATVSVAPIRKGVRYGGLRVTLLGHLGNARLPLQIDVGLGDVYRSEVVTIPPLLELPAAELRAYAKETVVAEKLEAMVSLGVANSRMKDFYDLAALAEEFPFQGQTVVDAIAETFGRRQTPLPETAFAELVAELLAEPSKPRQWAAFLKRATPRKPWSLDEALTRVTAFASSPLRAAVSGTAFTQDWSPKGPWA